MAKNIHTLLAIDIGSVSMKMAEFSFPGGGGIVLEKFAFCEFNSSDANIKELFSQKYHELLDKYEFKSTKVALSISGQASFCRLSRIPSLGGNEAAIAGIIGFEASQVVPYPMNEVVWDYQLMGKSGFGDVTEVNAEEEVDNPEEAATPKEPETIESLFVAVKSEQIEAYSDVIIDSKREVVSVDIAPLAMYNAAMATHCSDGECTVLLNIGSHNTDMVIVDGSRIQVRSFRISGDTITQQISKEFGIDFDEAEEMKIRLGFVALGGAYEEPESEFAAKISKIARNVMTRLHGEISRTITDWRSRHNGNAPVRLLLSGGGALMNYSQEFFDEKLNMEVDFLNVFPAVMLHERINRESILNVAPMFSELIGMALKNIIVCPMDISLLPESVKFLKLFRKKAIYFYASSLLIVVGLIFFYSTVRFGSNDSRNLVTETREKVEETTAMQKRVLNLSRINQQAATKYNAAKSWLDQRGVWIEILEDFQKALPDHMWVTSLEGVGDMIAKKESGKREERGGFSFGKAQDEPQAKASNTFESKRIDAADLKNVKEIKVRLYALVYDRDLLEDELFAALKESKYFDSAVGSFAIDEYQRGTDKFNVNAFTVRLKLKKAIEK